MEEAIRDISIEENAAAQPQEVPVAAQFVPDEETRSNAIAKSARKVFSRMGLACCVMFAVASALTIILLLVLQEAFPQLAEEQWLTLTVTLFSTQLVGIGLACLLLKKMPRFVTDPRSLSFKGFLKCIPVCILLAFAGNLAGTMFNLLLSRLLGYRPVSAAPVASFLDIPFWGLVLLLAAIGPFMEELLFRKVLIDRMRGYGERLAVVTSALMFGLMHGNLVQSFYTFLVGLLFGYVYLSSGSIWYSYGLHFIMNLFMGVLPMQLGKDPALRDIILGTASEIDPLETVSIAQNPAMLIFLLYELVIIAFCVAGLVILIKNAKRIRFMPAPLQVPKGRAFSSVWINLGMILFVILCIGNAVVYVIQMQ